MSISPGAPLTFRKVAGDTTVLVVIQESGDLLVLDPKPGDASVKNRAVLHMVVVNRTSADCDGEIRFECPMEDPDRAPYTFALKPGASRLIPIQLRDFFVGLPSSINVIAVGYLVIVGNQIIDPDVKIQR